MVSEHSISSHQCGLGSNPGVDVIHALRLLITFLCSKRLIFLRPSPFLERKKKFQIPIRPETVRRQRGTFLDVVPQNRIFLIRFLHYKRFHL